MPRYDVFLSHASADKPAVEHLARKLREEGFEPFLDKWHLIPGEPWQEGMEQALRQSRTCAVFLGKEIGPWQNEEMRTALARRVKNREYRIIPVLLPDGPKSGLDELSELLGRLTWVDFRAGLDDEDAFWLLLAGIQGKAPGPGSGGGGGVKPAYRCMAPAREPFVERSEYEKVREALLVHLDKAKDSGGTPTGTPTVGITTAIQGAGGFGKTALAIELCYDERVRARYPDGILWAQMRDNLDSDGRLKEIRDLLRRWTNQDPPAFETVAKAGQHLIALLEGKRVLLVVDDAWSPEDVAPFRGLNLNAALLVTTRNSGTLPDTALRIRVDAMKSEEAIELLGKEIPRNGQERFGVLSARLGEWPLLLKIVNRQLRALIEEGFSLEQALREVEETIEIEGLTAFDREEFRHQAVALTVEVSLKRVPAQDAARFGQLAIFPEDEAISLSVLEKLWGLAPFQVKRLCERFHELSLLFRFNRKDGYIQLHDVIRAYLIRKMRAELPALQQMFLEAYCPASGNWADLPQKASYPWRNLAYHLIRAGDREVFKTLLINFEFLRSKLAATDINSLLADYPSFQSDLEVRLVGEALALSAYILADHPDQLCEQLWGRLKERAEPGIQSLLKTAHQRKKLWLRPRIASLTRPGEARFFAMQHLSVPEALTIMSGGRAVSGSSSSLLVWDLKDGRILRVLEGHSREVRSVGALDSRRVVSGSDDGTLRAWDVESGQTIRVLEGHSKRINAVTVLDCQRVASASDDRTVRVWDVESGRTLHILEGHSAWVSAVAVLDCRRLISGSHDGTLRIWDMASGKTLCILQAHAKSISSLAVLNTSRVVSGSVDQTMRVWDVELGQADHVFEGHTGQISTVAVVDSRRVVSGSSDRTLRVWDLEAGSACCLFILDAPVTALATVSSGQIIAATDATGRVHFFDLIES